MTGDRLGRRILAIVVSTRAAARSFEVGDPQAEAAVRRGLTLLDGIELDVSGDGVDSGVERVERARGELTALLEPATAEGPQSSE